MKRLICTVLVALVFSLIGAKGICSQKKEEQRSSRKTTSLLKKATDSREIKNIGIVEKRTPHINKVHLNEEITTIIVAKRNQTGLVPNVTVVLLNVPYRIISARIGRF